MQRETAEKIRKGLWHFRWILLVCTIIFSFVSFQLQMDMQQIAFAHGIIWPCYFLVKQFEAYFECVASCRI